RCQSRLLPGQRCETSCQVFRCMLVREHSGESVEVTLEGFVHEAQQHGVQPTEIEEGCGTTKAPALRKLGEVRASRRGWRTVPEHRQRLLRNSQHVHPPTCERA